jgi:hypothetical protein
VALSTSSGAICYLTGPDERRWREQPSHFGQREELWRHGQLILILCKALDTPDAVGEAGDAELTLYELEMSQNSGVA